MARRKTHEEFVEEVKKAQPHIKIVGRYRNSNSTVKCSCDIDNYEWESIPRTITQNGCPVCRGVKYTPSTFKEKAEILNNEIILLSDYVNYDTPMKVQCKNKNCKYEWDMLPSNILQGKSCPKCKKCYHYTHNDFVEKLNELYGDEYTVIGKYKNSKTKITIRHNVCNNNFDAVPTRILSQVSHHGCPFCNGGIKYTNEEFVKRVFELCGDEYTFLEEYQNSSTKIKCRHNVCRHEYYIAPNDFVNGMHRCPKCFGSHKKDTELFIKEVEELDNEYTVLGEYVNAREKIKMMHNVCETIFYPTPDNFLRGGRCPNCQSSKGEKAIDYYLNVNNIEYISHYKYDDLFGVGGGYLSYDFYLPSYNLLIEFQGIQHEKPIEIFGGQEQFLIQQEHDNRKRNYANSHNIELLEIWYYDFDNIEQILESRLLKQST